MTAFNETTNSTGLIQICEQELFGDSGFTQISGNTDRLKIITNYINEGYSRYVEKAITADGTWEFDDSNQTDYAIVTTNLVANQSDYTLSANFIDILGVELANSAGTFYGLTELDERVFSQEGISMTQAFINPSQPSSYNKTANSIFLLPAPNYSYTAGLKLRVQRPPLFFVYTDTTKVPGFNPNHHQYLVNYACYKYATARSMQSAPRFQEVVIQYEEKLIPEFYSSRNKDKIKKFYPKRKSSR
jgi:hypothetical protein